MEYFLDTASIDEVKKILPCGVISGLTTNQKIFLQEGSVDFKRRALELIVLVNAPVSLELTNIDSIREAREYYSWDSKHVVVKVAMRGRGRIRQRVKRIYQTFTENCGTENHCPVE
ncbi:MAG: transaldolase family protein [Candidatus Bathyarchaeia archaeon]